MNYKEASNFSDIKVGTTAYIGDDKSEVTILSCSGSKRRYILAGEMHFIKENFTSTTTDGVTTVTSNSLTSDETIYIEE